MTRLLFWMDLAAAAILVGLVILCPLIDDGRWSVLTLFANDVVLRRTGLLAAAGLTATAFIFFRSSSSLWGARRRQPPPVVGA